MYDKKIFFSFFLFSTLFIFAQPACAGGGGGSIKQPSETTKQDTDNNTGGDDNDTLERFTKGIFPDALKGGGYIDSIFINKSGDRIYFTHTIYPPNILSGASTIQTCADKTVLALPNHVSLPRLEWNTDLYYIEWDGAIWSDPINLGTEINSLGMECCVWLNDDETEMIFASATYIGGEDGGGPDHTLRPSGNYRATRAHRDAAWSTPVALPGKYGTEDFTQNTYRHDIHKTPSGNLYLWEKFPLEGEQGIHDKLLLFGERIGGTYEDPIYADPVIISGSANYDSQIWVNDAETQIMFNRRQPNGETKLYKMTREEPAESWSTPAEVSVSNFADSEGHEIWGEPTLDQYEDFMLFIRFNLEDFHCNSVDFLYAKGNIHDGFGTPIHLNAE